MIATTHILARKMKDEAIGDVRGSFVRTLYYVACHSLINNQNDIGSLEADRIVNKYTPLTVSWPAGRPPNECSNGVSKQTSKCLIRWLRRCTDGSMNKWRDCLMDEACNMRSATWSIDNGFWLNASAIGPNMTLGKFGARWIGVAEKALFNALTRYATSNVVDIGVD